MALGRPGMVTLLQGLGLALSVPLMLLLIPRWGIAGAAASLLLSTCARFIFICVSFNLTLRVPFPRLMPDKSDWYCCEVRSTMSGGGRPHEGCANFYQERRAKREAGPLGLGSRRTCRSFTPWYQGTNRLGAADEFVLALYLSKTFCKYYTALVCWLFFLSPLLRRLIEFRTGSPTASFVMISPYLGHVSRGLVCCITGGTMY